MFGAHDLALFFLSALALNLTPGPDMANVVASSARAGAKGGIVAALGAGVGGLVHIAAAACGISALLAASAAAFSAIKFAGAAYLVVLGLRMAFARSGAAVPQSAPAAARDPAPRLVPIFRQAVAINVLNPKVALFFLAFLPQFIDADAPGKPLAFLFLGLIFDVNGTIWNAAIACAAARIARAFAPGGSFRRRAERALGALFVGLGVRLAFVRP